ncbi:MAG TPA: hypothetical protein VII69_08430 [Candidatus Eremiobacteraceae bacterium]
MPKKTNRARKAGEPPRGHLTAHGESQRESSGRMAGQRVANVRREKSQPKPVGDDKKTERPKR